LKPNEVAAPTLFIGVGGTGCKIVKKVADLCAPEEKESTGEENLQTQTDAEEPKPVGRAEKREIRQREKAAKREKKLARKREKAAKKETAEVVPEEVQSEVEVSEDERE